MPASAASSFWAHPRSRGENLDARFGGELVLGSSPLTRGKPSGMYPSPPVSGAHPRSRGENDNPIACATLMKGSSPLTRGKRVPRTPRDDGDGLIPAHAGKTRDEGASDAAPRAHPRSRGENLLEGLNRVVGLGSSPLTRGKPVGRRRALQAGGLIPAHAGKTPCSSRFRARARAHPRSRGENLIVTCARASAEGSSPLTRGKRSRAWSPTPTPGLIPAHAGKTAPHDAGAPPAPAHPRSRGENQLPETCIIIGMGSSPLTRGKRSLIKVGCVQPGLIPAHAGKTCVAVSWMR